jgi:hypothetical protein
MNNINGLNIICLEYMKEVCGHKCWREHKTRYDGSGDWHNTVIRGMFNPMEDLFWKWLGEEKHLLSMSETCQAMEYSRKYHESIGLDVSSKIYATSTNAQIVTMYANAYVHVNFKTSLKCITDVYDKLDRTDNINTFNDALIELMAVDQEFNRWIYGGKFMFGISTSLELAEACVDDDITVGNVKYDFDNR